MLKKFLNEVLIILFHNNFLLDDKLFYLFSILYDSFVFSLPIEEVEGLEVLIFFL